MSDLVWWPSFAHERMTLFGDRVLPMKEWPCLVTEFCPWKNDLVWWPSFAHERMTLFGDRVLPMKERPCLVTEFCSRMCSTAIFDSCLRYSKFIVTNLSTRRALSESIRNIAHSIKALQSSILNMVRASHQMECHKQSNVCDLDGPIRRPYQGSCDRSAVEPMRAGVLLSQSNHAVQTQLGRWY